MIKMLHRLTEQEMQELAEKLIGMKINKARGYTRRLDPDSELELLRVGVGHELLTRYRLPNLGVRVTLVELPRERVFEDGGNIPAFAIRKRFEPEFVEARVEPLE
ncbi:MAG: hypothetical protein HPY64_03405 [Anaerolineae bacterium]|nr:hypothetical protein [Anaerolineae bacterium]